MNIQELAKKAGMNVSLWDFGAGSIVFTMGTDGLARGALERFCALVLEEAAKVCDGVYYQNIGPGNGEVRYGITACSVSIREKARALKGAKE